jgi:hypothetical protein
MKISPKTIKKLTFVDLFVNRLHLVHADAKILPISSLQFTLFKKSTAARKRALDRSESTRQLISTTP